MKNKEKGVTLVSLVITIVVMIILAGTMINNDTVNDDAINMATKKKEETELLSIKEEIKTELTENPPENYEQLISMLANYGVVQNEDSINDAKLITTNGNYTIFVKDIWNVYAIDVPE